MDGPPATGASPPADDAPDSDAGTGTGTDSERSRTTGFEGVLSRARERADGSAAARRLLVVAALGAVPWTVLARYDLTFVFAFGLLNDASWSLVTLPEYLRYSPYGRPAAVESWLVGVGLYAAALASALGGVLGVEDRRLTGGLLVLAGACQFPMVRAFSRDPATTAVPVGSVLLLVAAWWLYWPAVGARAGSRGE